MLQGLLWRCMCVCVCVCVFSKTAFPLYLKVSHDTRWVSDVLQGLLRCLGGGIARGEVGECSGVLTLCIQTTSLKGAQGLL